MAGDNGPTLASIAAQKPARMTVANMATGDTLEVQYNPTEVEEALEVAYGHQIIQGMSHEQLQYSNTKNVQPSLTLSFDALTQVGPNRYDVMAARRFLMALCYARRGGTDVRSGAPPRALFIWPGLYTLQVKVISMRSRFTRFALSGDPTAFTAQLAFEEVRDTRLFSEDVAAYGTQRMAGAAGEDP